MMQVGGCFPFSASDQMLQAWPSLGASDNQDGFADAATTSPGIGAASWPAPSSSVLTPGAGYSEELFGYTLAEYEGAIVKQSAPSDASGWRAFAKVAGRNFRASRMAVSVLNVGGSWMRLGLWDASGNLLNRTARFAPVANTVLSVSLLGAVQLYGSAPYYLGYWSNDTTANLTLRCVSGRSTSPRSPLMQRNDLNEDAGNLGGSSDMFTPYRPWLMVME